MVNEPALFFKANQTLRAQQIAAQLTAGPEQQWIAALAVCDAQLKKMTDFLPRVFYEGQDSKEQKELVNAFARCKHALETIETTMRGKEVC